MSDQTKPNSGELLYGNNIGIEPQQVSTNEHTAKLLKTALSTKQDKIDSYFLYLVSLSELDPSFDNHPISDVSISRVETKFSNVANTEVMSFKKGALFPSSLFLGDTAFGARDVTVAIYKNDVMVSSVSKTVDLTSTKKSFTIQQILGNDVTYEIGDVFSIGIKSDNELSMQVGDELSYIATSLISSGGGSGSTPKPGIHMELVDDTYNVLDGDKSTDLLTNEKADAKIKKAIGAIPVVTPENSFGKVTVGLESIESTTPNDTLKVLQGPHTRLSVDPETKELSIGVDNGVLDDALTTNARVKELIALIPAIVIFGPFATIEELITGSPTAKQGDHGLVHIVGEADEYDDWIYLVVKKVGKWTKLGGIGALDLTNYYTKAETNELIKNIDEKVTADIASQNLIITNHGIKIDAIELKFNTELQDTVLQEVLRVRDINITDVQVGQTVKWNGTGEQPTKINDSTYVRADGFTKIDTGEYDEKFMAWMVENNPTNISGTAITMPRIEESISSYTKTNEFGTCEIFSNGKMIFTTTKEGFANGAVITFPVAFTDIPELEPMDYYIPTGAVYNQSKNAVFSGFIDITTTSCKVDNSLDNNWKCSCIATGHWKAVSGSKTIDLSSAPVFFALGLDPNTKYYGGWEENAGDVYYIELYNGIIFTNVGTYEEPIWFDYTTGMITTEGASIYGNLTLDIPVPKAYEYMKVRSELAGLGEIISTAVNKEPYPDGAGVSFNKGIYFANKATKWTGTPNENWDQLANGVLVSINDAVIGQIVNPFPGSDYSWLKMDAVTVYTKLDKIEMIPVYEHVDTYYPTHIIDANTFTLPKKETPVFSNGIMPSNTRDVVISHDIMSYFVGFGLDISKSYTGMWTDVAGNQAAISLDNGIISTSVPVSEYNPLTGNFDPIVLAHKGATITIDQVSFTAGEVRNLQSNTITCGVQKVVSFSEKIVAKDYECIVYRPCQELQYVAQLRKIKANGDVYFLTGTLSGNLNWDTMVYTDVYDSISYIEIYNAEVGPIISEFDGFMLMKGINTTAGRGDLIAIPGPNGTAYEVNNGIWFDGSTYKCIKNTVWNGALTADWELSAGSGGSSNPLVVNGNATKILNTDDTIVATYDEPTKTTLLSVKGGITPPATRGATVAHLSETEIGTIFDLVKPTTAVKKTKTQPKVRASKSATIGLETSPFTDDGVLYENGLMMDWDSSITPEDPIGKGLNIGKGLLFTEVEVSPGSGANLMLMVMYLKSAVVSDMKTFGLSAKGYEFYDTNDDLTIAGIYNPTTGILLFSSEYMASLQSAVPYDTVQALAVVNNYTLPISARKCVTAYSRNVVDGTPQVSTFIKFNADISKLTGNTGEFPCKCMHIDNSSEMGVKFQDAMIVDGNLVVDGLVTHSIDYTTNKLESVDVSFPQTLVGMHIPDYYKNGGVVPPKPTEKIEDNICLDGVSKLDKTDKGYYDKGFESLKTAGGIVDPTNANIITAPLVPTATGGESVSGPHRHMRIADTNVLRNSGTFLIEVDGGYWYGDTAKSHDGLIYRCIIDYTKVTALTDIENIAIWENISNSGTVKLPEGIFASVVVGEPYKVGNWALINGVQYKCIKDTVWTGTVTSAWELHEGVNTVANIIPGNGLKWAGVFGDKKHTLEVVHGTGDGDLTTGADVKSIVKSALPLSANYDSYAKMLQYQHNFQDYQLVTVQMTEVYFFNGEKDGLILLNDVASFKKVYSNDSAGSNSTLSGFIQISENDIKFSIKMSALTDDQKNASIIINKSEVDPGLYSNLIKHDGLSTYCMVTTKTVEGVYIVHAVDVNIYVNKDISMSINFGGLPYDGMHSEVSINTLMVMANR